ncbi:diguanylate cyclase [Amycolatopsis sp. NPDC059657]|uniref:bifunctional diguanylate cyclase/phosphohydrolase n=1 Tax=Amycolatopsis sp. NPDC059657 TaxID=3346899 RepID=UPI00366FAA5B
MTTYAGAARRWTWAGYLVTGFAVIAAYYVTVISSAPQLLRVVLYCSVTVSAFVAVFYGCVRNRPAAKLPWVLLGLGQIVYATADTSFYVAHYIVGNLDFPALADVFYLGHYPLVVAGLVVLIRSRTPGWDLPAVLDAAMLAVVGGMLSWLYLIAPQATSAAPMLVKVASVGYPMMDLAMFAVALRLVLGQGRRPVAFSLLSLSLLSFVVADTVYVVQQVNGTYSAGNFLDAIWLSGNLLLGASALHPTMGKVAETVPFGAPVPGPWRIAALCTAVLIAPATVLIENARGAHSGIPVVACACAVLFLLTIARLAGLVSQQRKLAITDALTGLRTRRHFEAQMVPELARARRAGGSVAVLIADVDHFKSVNDRYGHPVGDEVLIEIGKRLREAIRPGDHLARYGGEEFAILIRDAGPDDPAVIAERLRQQVADRPIVVSGDVWIGATISVGTASYPLHGNTPGELFGAADRALYSAKAQGRDRVVLADLSGHPPVDQHTERSLTLDLEKVADEVDGWLSNHEHSKVVGYWSGLVATGMGLAPEVAGRVELAGRLHDIGKVLVPQEVWTKEKPLTDEEWLLVRQHPEFGCRLAKTVAGLGDVAEIIRQHHERFDGTGYPGGLAGAHIRIEARILAVCDSWAAMLADRPYQKALTEDGAVRELLSGRGTQFDPDVVATFLTLHRHRRLGPLPLLDPAGKTPAGRA